ncbi:tRNA1(Val) (adenine(37)-N6)-methyltransferase [Evansella tamaricis]|uniref:tRNA1(Val) (Adenine(37)-N6)-methyltransferase n=1 Tax=Evansella tamaricis TaxID=2069301 RepID=A0ABS6JMQ8_9BACI|nr:tRNA1(Val) (adenine(37)-N6)-methyltransferase [Evansella tamaricis]MBU9713705.1 tRNA1(Val) (adenine(37)-N6)-methyltransferase [Evansella tamaricis]
MESNNSIERLDYMPGKKRYIFQRDDVFSFSIDAVLLARFAKVPSDSGKVIDLCTGNGAIPLLLSLKTKACIDGVEIQNILSELAIKSCIYNGLENQIRIINSNILELYDEVSWGEYDLVTCNPPYFALTSEKGKNVNEKVSFARHEIACTLDDVIRISAKLVKQTGRLSMVHRPERLTEILLTMKKYRLEPKKIQFVHPKQDREANMVLVEGVRSGKTGIRTLPPIFVYGNGKQYTKEFKELYENW